MGVVNWKTENTRKVRIFLGDRNIYARKQEHKLVVTSEEKELGERVLAAGAGRMEGGLQCLQS